MQHTNQRGENLPKMGIVSEVNNNEITNKKTAPTAGFNIHPENINKIGRPPKEWTWKDLLEEVAEEFIEVTAKNGKRTQWQYKKLVARKLFQKAAQGDIQAIKELMNRRDGMPKQQTDLTTGGDKIQYIVEVMPDGNTKKG